MIGSGRISSNFHLPPEASLEKLSGGGVTEDEEFRFSEKNRCCAMDLCCIRKARTFPKRLSLCAVTPDDDENGHKTHLSE